MIDVKRARRTRLQDSDKKYEQLLREFKKEKYLYPPEPHVKQPKRESSHRESYVKIGAGLLSAMLLAGLIVFYFL